MNISLSFEKMKTKQYHLTAKQRLMVLVGIGLTTIFITTYATTEQAVVPTPPSNNSQPQVNTSSKPVIPIGSQMAAVKPIEQVIRDPFAKLPEAEKKQADHGLSAAQSTVPSIIPRNAVSPVPIPHENLRLTGIVSNEERSLAVIMLGNKSQSYSLNDMVGTYKILAIHENSVILTNAAGKLVLGFESTGQKGDNNSEK